MPNLNDHVVEYLKWYCQMRTKPGFALMVKGPWGCGKSYLVTRTMEDLSASTSFLYVSLYGISSKEQIEEKFLQQMHPWLTHKHAILGARIAKAALGAIRIDWEQTQGTKIQASGHVPSIDLVQHFSDKEGAVLVFDDLERCTMPLGETLGYLNYFVEKEGFKVIVIADESKLEGSKITEYSTYEDVSEKLIGTRLEVVADTNAAFDDGIKSPYMNASIQRALMSNKNVILNLVERSGHKNLRTLNKIFLEFERIWDALDQDIQKNKEVICEILKRFTILSLEIHSKTIDRNEILELMIGRISRATGLNQNKLSPRDTVLAKLDRIYGEDLHKNLVDPSFWHNFFTKGHADQATLNSSLRASPYLAKQNLSDWQRFVNYLDLEDDQFEAIYRSVEKSLRECKITKPGQILTLAAMYLFFVRQGLITDTNEEKVVERFKHYASTVFSTPEASEELKDMWYFSINGSIADESPQYAEIYQSVTNAVVEAQNHLYERSSNEVLEALASDPHKLFPMLCLGSTPFHEFQKYPILQAIDPEAFVESLYQIPNNKKAIVGSVLSARYEYIGSIPVLAVEIDWLQTVLQKIQVRHARPTVISSIAISSVINGIEEGIKSIKKATSSPSIDPNQN